MNRLLSLLLILFLLFTVAFAAPNWVSVASYVDHATYRLSYPTDDGGAYVCTGFVIDQPRGYVLTAAHCLGEGLSADAWPAFPVWEDKEVDLAVIALTRAAKPALKPVKADPRMGQPVLAFGYGYGEHSPIVREGIVANPEMNITGLKKTWLVFSGGAIGGMSGGPIVDGNGKVLSIVLMSDQENICFGRTISTVWNYTSPYWQFQR